MRRVADHDDPASWKLVSLQLDALELKSGASVALHRDFLNQLAQVIRVRFGFLLGEVCKFLVTRANCPCWISIIAEGSLFVNPQEDVVVITRIAIFADTIQGTEDGALIIASKSRIHHNIAGMGDLQLFGKLGTRQFDFSNDGTQR